LQQAMAWLHGDMDHHNLSVGTALLLFHSMWEWF